jgi:hypothetical protein
MAHIVRILCAALLLCSNSYALEPVRENTPGNPYLEVLVSDSTRFIKEWISTPLSHTPEIRRVNETRYNQKVYAGIVISDFGIDSSSNVDFVIGIDVIDPNGAVVLRNDAFAVHKGQVKGGSGVIMSNTVLDMMFGAGDPVGVYKINATLTDNIAKKRATGSTSLTITP